MERFANSTSFHGVVLTYYAKETLSKLFWAVVTLAGFIMVTNQCLWLLDHYFNDDPSSNVNYVIVNNLTFPNITICTLQRFNRTSMLLSGLVDDDPDLVDRISALFFSPFMTTVITLDEYNDYVTTRSNKTSQDYLDIVEAHRFKCEKLFPFCYWENHRRVRSCCKQAKSFLIHSGPCFSFQLNKDQTLPGPTGGLRLFYQQPAIQDLFTDSLFNIYTEEGLVLYTDPEDAVLELDSTFIPLYQHSTIHLEAQEVQLLAKAGLCTRRSEAKRLEYFNSYSYRKCQIDCITGKLIEFCGCTGLNTYINLTPDLICSPEMMLSCFNKVIADPNNHDMPTAIWDCRKVECINTCNHWRYGATISGAKAVWEPFQRAFELAFGMTNVTIIDIYFNEISKQQLIQVPSVSSGSLLANVGGSLGMYTGGSAITIIHLLYFLSKVFFQTSVKVPSPTKEVMEKQQNQKIGDHSGIDDEAWKSPDWSLKMYEEMDTAEPSLRNFAIPRPIFTLTKRSVSEDGI